MSTRTTAPAPRPAWCRECDARTRLVTRPDGRMARCQRCHPLSVDAGRSAPQPTLPLGGQTSPGTSDWAEQVVASSSAPAAQDALRIVVWLALAGGTFSANVARERMTVAGVPGPAVGAAFAAALARGLVVEVGQTRSTDPGTHGKRVGVYRAGPALSIGAAP